ncbi:MAG: DUF2612 domain-containing protein [Rectinemataceae bacterium]
MNSTLVAYYVALLIMQYMNMPNANAFLAAIVTKLMIYDLIVSVRDGYNLNTAVGAQQDILGKYVGVNRVITGVDFTRQYFGFMRAGTTAPYTFQPLMVAGAAAPDTQFLRAGALNNSLYSLDDTEFGELLAYRVSLNYMPPTDESIDQFMLEFFGSEAYATDNMNMTMTYTFSSKSIYQRWATIMQSEDLLPRPAGVEILIAFEST